MKPTYQVDARLKEFATATQARYIDAVNANGSYRAAARAMGVNMSVIHRCVAVVARNAALRGYAPQADMAHVVPDGFKVRGVSTYYNADGKVTGQWVKSREDADRREEMVREAIRVLAEEVRELAPIVEPPARVNADLLAVYPLGDPHVGMYAWAKEAGEDFNLDIARRLTLGAFDRLVSAAPPAHTALILPLGDVFHIDNQTNVTPGHGHQLDADGRFTKVLQVGIEMYRHSILRCLEKHENVVVRFVAGNHDPHSVWALAFTIAAFFANSPRVTVDLSPAKHWFYRFGQVLIGATHGDTVKPEELLGVMVADRPEDWGATKHRYWYTGHIHHQTVRELAGGLIAESFRTLAARDAYASGKGYRAGRDMRLIVHDRQHGEIERHRCDVGMLA